MPFKKGEKINNLNNVYRVHLCIFVIADEYDTLPWYKKACQWICGIEKIEDHPTLTPEEQAAIDRKQQSIHQDKFWRRILNANAIILMTLAVFLWGFYA